MKAPFLVAVLAAATAHAMPGELDHAFGAEGKVELAVGGGIARSEASSIATLPNGRVLLAGTTTAGDVTRIALLRLLADGTLDPSFGERGQVALHLPGNDPGRVGMTLDATGRILLAGGESLTRFDGSGGLDESFSAAGIFNAREQGLRLFYPGAVTARPDGRILVAGSGFGPSRPGANFNQIALLQLLPDGTPDTAFADGGRFVAPDAGVSGAARAVAVLADGRAIVVGSVYPDREHSRLLRLDALGVLDPVFGSAGVVDTGELVARAVVVSEADGRAFVAGGMLVDDRVVPAVQCYLANGTLDPAFGTGGLATVSVASDNSALTGLALQRDGALVATGYTLADDERSELLVVRFRGDGVPDVTFGSSGVVRTTFSGDVDIGAAVAVQADGKPVIAGHTRSLSGTSSRVAVLRLVASSEVCGGCRDADGDGLVDLEDPECCASETSLSLERLAVRPLRRGSRFALELQTGGSPAARDFQVQVRQNDTTRCAIVPGDRLKRCRNSLCGRFAAPRRDPTLAGIRAARLDPIDGGQRIRIRGGGDLLALSRAGSVELRLAFRNPGAPASQCAAIDAAVRWTAKRRLSLVRSARPAVSPHVTAGGHLAQRPDGGVPGPPALPGGPRSGPR